MPQFGFVVVEGPHDTEFVSRLIDPFGFRRVGMVVQLDPFFHRLIPTEYPPGGDLQRRMSTPLFVKNSTHVVAIICAGGDTQLVNAVRRNLASVDDPNLVSGVAIILDADSGKNRGTAADRFTTLQTEMNRIGLTLDGPAGSVTPGPPRRGAFVLPDNVSAGTLEDLLLECGLTAYPNLLPTAEAHVQSALSDITLTPKDVEQLRKPAGGNKARVAVVANLLRPGKSLQVSIQDNRWLDAAHLAGKRVASVQTFLADVLQLSPPG